MACDVFGSEEAIAALAIDIEAERARAPNFPLTFAVAPDGPVLEVDPRQVLWCDEHLMAISRRNPDVAIALADAGHDEENDSLTHVSIFLYSKGRRRVVKSFSFDEEDRAQLKRLEAMLFRLEQRLAAQVPTVTAGAPSPPPAARQA